MNGKIILSLLTAALLTLVPLVGAQQPKKVARSRYLSLRPAPFDQDKLFKEELRDRGWIDGQNLTIEYRWAAGKVDRLAVLAKELVSAKVDVIVTSSTPSV